jgi:hypothetical protein
MMSLRYKPAYLGTLSSKHVIDNTSLARVSLRFGGEIAGGTVVEAEVHASAHVPMSSSNNICIVIPSI